MFFYVNFWRYIYIYIDILCFYIFLYLLNHSNLQFSFVDVVANICFYACAALWVAFYASKVLYRYNNIYTLYFHYMNSDLYYIFVATSNCMDYQTSTNLFTKWIINLKTYPYSTTIAAKLFKQNIKPCTIVKDTRTKPPFGSFILKSLAIYIKLLFFFTKLWLISYYTNLLIP